MTFHWNSAEPMPEYHEDPVRHIAQWELVWVSDNTGPRQPGEGHLQCWCGQTKLREGELR